MAVEGMENIRSSLPAIVDGFQDNPHGDAVHFGRHRRDEAVLISSAEYERLVAAARQVEALERLGAIRMVRDRLADGRFSEGAVDDLFAAAESR